MPSLSFLLRGLAATLLVPATMYAQQGARTTANDTTANANRSTTLKAVTVTATRTTTDVRDVAAPVLVLDSTAIRSRMATGTADLLREQPGVDVVGTGVNQARPMIRGQRGQRILLLEDGLRLNNSRRQQDFGEIPSLVDADQVARIEVVRGPASVLYGTDAIGGVINLITRSPNIGGPERITGRVGYQYGGAGGLSKTTAAVGGRSGSWAFDLNGSARVAGDYDAPSGSYGNVTLAGKTPLQHSGVRDQNLSGTLAWSPRSTLDVFARYQRYAADDAGFGYVTPAAIGADPTEVEITYPMQEFGKFTTGLHASALAMPIADRFDFSVYRQRNQRDLAQRIFAFFGPGTPPGAGIDIRTANFTDITSFGFRAEASKVLSRMIVTYGVDLFNDNSVNTDSSKTTVVGFGPPTPKYSTATNVPNATLTSYGAFAQTDMRLHDRFSLIVGGRGQFVNSSPKATAGRTDVIESHSNGTGVYAVNAVWRLDDQLSLVATAGRGFRSPNLVERYFDGPTPEGSAFQKSAPDLLAETSFNVDGGVKYRNGRFTAEASLFQNDIRDAIIAAPTGEKQGTLPIYQNVNVGKLRAKGAEISATALLWHGFTAGANYSTVKSSNLAQANVPVGDTYASKLNVSLGWADNSGRFWSEYSVRRNGEQKDIVATASPVGPVLPAFTVQSVRAGIRGWSFSGLRQDISVGVNNIGNVLYAETANASFFRPEPGRHFVIALSTAF